MKPYFPRGNGPLVSVLIPTRGRPDHLEKAIESCIQNAHNLSQIEFILKIDDDDKPTGVRARGMAIAYEDKVKIKIIDSPRGRGYHDIHLWLKDMGNASQADWLFVFSDDGVMETRHWDLILHNYVLSSCWHGRADDVAMMCPTVGGVEGAVAFYFLRKNTFDLLGGMGDSPYADAWLYQVLGMIHSTFTMKEVRIDHPRDGHDYGMRGGVPEPFMTGAYTIASMQAGQKKVTDVLKLLTHITSKDHGAVWYTKPNVVDAWYVWQQALDCPLINVYCGEDGVRIFDRLGVSKLYKPEEVGGAFRPIVP